MKEAEQPTDFTEPQSKNKTQKGHELTAESNQSGQMQWSPIKLAGNKRALEDDCETEEPYAKSDREEGEMSEEEEDEIITLAPPNISKGTAGTMADSTIVAPPQTLNPMTQAGAIMRAPATRYAELQPWVAPNGKELATGKEAMNPHIQTAILSACRGPRMDEETEDNEEEDQQGEGKMTELEAGATGIAGSEEDERVRRESGQVENLPHRGKARGEERGNDHLRLKDDDQGEVLGMSKWRRKRHKNACRGYNGLITRREAHQEGILPGQ